LLEHPFLSIFICFGHISERLLLSHALNERTNVPPKTHQIIPNRFVACRDIFGLKQRSKLRLHLTKEHSVHLTAMRVVNERVAEIRSRHNDPIGPQNS
jgi:hypothetical protein